MAVFKEPDVTPNESSDDEEWPADLDRSGYEDETIDAAPKIQSPARWSTLFRTIPMLDRTNRPSLDLTTAATVTVPNQETIATAVATAPPSIINYLPHEIILQIFRHILAPRDLHSCLLVSRSWCQCSVELLWQKPQFAKLTQLSKLIHILGKKDPLFEYASFIRRLNLTLCGSDLTNQYLIRTSKCTRLERLTLYGCTSVSNEALESVLSSLSHLVALDITGIVDAADSAIVASASVAPRLQGVNLGGCKKITDIGILALATKCTSLRRIKLSGLEQLTDEPIIALAKNCKMLLELDLHNCSLITDVAIREVWTHSELLREFRLSGITGLTDRAFPSRRGIANGAMTVDQLQYQLYQQQLGVPEEQMHDPLILGRSCDHLRMLDLTGCGLLTDAAVAGIVHTCPKLRNFVLAKCGNLTDMSLSSICKLGRHLHNLHLGHVSNITDRAVTQLARDCSRLRYIDLACCPQLTDMSVFELAALPKLKRIGLVRVPNLTDQAIYALADQQTFIERIHLSYCENITLQAINYLLQRTVKLTHLSLTGIPAFKKPELQRFCRPPPTDFTANQRAAFCVYSGHGVIELRRYMSLLVDSLNNPERASEGNGTLPDLDDNANDGDTSGGGSFVPSNPDWSHLYAPPQLPTSSNARNQNYAHLLLAQRMASAVGQRPPSASTSPAPPQAGYRTNQAILLPSSSSTTTRYQAPSYNLTQDTRGSSFVPSQVNHTENYVLNFEGSQTASPLPYPLTGSTTATVTPDPVGFTAGNQANATSSSSRRRSPNTFLSFATALRGALVGGSGSGSNTNSGRGSSPSRNANTVPTAASSRPMFPISSPAPLSSQNVGASYPSSRVWSQMPTWTNGHSSPLPSPSASAAAFATSGGPSSSRDSSSSSANRLNASRTNNALELNVPVQGQTTVGMYDSARSQWDMRALEESLQSALSGNGSSTSRSRDRLRGREFDVSEQGIVGSRRGPNGSASSSSRTAGERNTANLDNSTAPLFYSSLSGPRNRSRH